MLGGLLPVSSYDQYRSVFTILFRVAMSGEIKMIDRRIIYTFTILIAILEGCTGHTNKTSEDHIEVHRISTSNISSCEHLGKVELEKSFWWSSPSKAKTELIEEFKKIIIAQGGNSYHLNIIDHKGTSGPSVYLVADYYKCPNSIFSK